MKTQKQFRSVGALLVSLSLGPLCAAQAPPPRFSLDYQGPTIAAPECANGVPVTEGDIYMPCTPGNVPAFGPLPIPMRSLTGGVGGLGLLLHAGCVGHPPGLPCGVEVDAFSYGSDADLSPSTPGIVSMGKVWFSVDRHARGIPGPIVPSVFSERPWGEAATDLFASLALPIAPLPPFAAPPLNVGVLDGNGLVSGSGANYPGLGLMEPSQPTPPPLPGDDLDAFDLPENVPAAALPFFSLDSGFVDPFTGMLNTASAAAHGFVGGDVLTIGAGGFPVVYAPALLLGLNFFGPDTDDLNALALLDNGDGIFQPSLQPNQWWGGATDMLLFSVRRGSAVVGMPDSIFGLPIEPGDILTVPLPSIFGGLSPFPGIYIAAENLGLLTARTHGLIWGDDLNALDTVKGPYFDCDGDGIEDGVAIALGIVLDLNMDGIPDNCQQVGTPGCFCPNGGVCIVNPDPNAGCQNSTGAGALLTAAGSTSVGADNLVLTTTGMPLFQFGTYFMGTTPINVFFGDGILCGGGMIGRFIPLVNSGPTGSTTLGPGIVNTTINTMPPAFWIVAGQTWIFQKWYRDSFGPCGTGFNLSNAITVTFTP